MKIKGWDLNFFSSGEWQVCDERLKDLEKIHRPLGDKYPGYSPGRDKLFAALRAIPEGEVRCCIIGQDPYPTPKYATGLAFSIPGDIPECDWPPTLRTFLQEYVSDLGLDHPRHGNLEEWSSRGVLLWNYLPSCGSGRSLSHDWKDDSWGYLTREIVKTLAKKGIVFALLGQVARRCVNHISDTNNHVIVTSHPSPRGSVASRTPFVGSRLFSTINDKLNDLSLEPVDWRLS
jgi:uracil-DNA glycosylase